MLARVKICKSMNTSLELQKTGLSLVTVATRFTSVGSPKVKDCWKGHDPDDNTWILKSMSRVSFDFDK
jgi:hypothetical protein